MEYFERKGDQKSIQKAISLAEAKLGYHACVQGAIMKHCLDQFEVRKTQDYLEVGENLSQFQFPLSGAIDLQTGKLYVWQIARSFETTLGTNLTKSNIFLFKIKSVAESREMLDTYSGTIIDFIGESTYDTYFGPNGDLSGFSLSGNSILINNESVPIGQLNNLSNQLNQGEISIISIEVE